MNKRLRTLRDKLAQSKSARVAFVSSNIEMAVPVQIKALRDSRGWTQRDLADAMGVQQPVVSRLEQLGAGVSLRKLKAAAAAFDVGLVVRLVPFSELARWAVALTPDSLSAPAFDSDPGFEDQPSYAASWTPLTLDPADYAATHGEAYVGRPRLKYATQSAKSDNSVTLSGVDYAKARESTDAATATTVAA